ncbi:hypothetical protein OIU76_020721 [Salix suchowensis]|nr:hypothetical protein OIU76_020721 [Salix suchowensis]
MNWLTVQDLSLSLGGLCIPVSTKGSALLDPSPISSPKIMGKKDALTYREKVSVPSSSLFNIVTVRCGHCGNLLSVNMGASSQTLPLQDPQSQKLVLLNSEDLNKDFGSSSKCNKVNASESTEHHEPPRMPPIRPPEKRQRVPSAYNRFIKDEIQRIKAGNPDISHREAFSTAAKNLDHLPHSHLQFLGDADLQVTRELDMNTWAHFPHIHFGLKLDSNKHAKLDHPSIAGDGAQKTSGLYEINGSL